MRTLFKFIIHFTLMVCLVNAAFAQDNGPANTRKTSLTVTASASGDRVRFTAPSSVVQIRLEVYDSTARKRFDNEVRGGNVLDWQLQDGQAEPLADDTYLCAITVKSLAGKITQRIGSVTIVKGVASVQAVEALQMTAQQSQAVGPLEENASLTVLKDGETQTATVIAHNGVDGQITRGRGALSFRIGDFFRGKDTEQMRLTAEGNLGIGVANPQAKLDVAGAIRASQGIIFPDGSIQFSASRKTFGTSSLRDGQSKDKSGEGQGIRPEIAGTGTTGKIPKWQDGPNGILTDSVITELNGSIGINGPPNPTFKLDVAGHNRFRGSNVSFYLTGTKPGGNEWLFQTVDADGRLRIFENSTGGGERMSLTQSGNVGIGIASPTFKLHIVESGNHALYATSDLIGVWGNSSSSTGVYGSSAPIIGTTYGVQGQSQSSTGAGVYGRNDSSHGVEGFSTNGTGVAGFNRSLFGAVFGSNSGSGPGVYGQTTSTVFNQAGVFGEATATSGTVVGVYGKALNDPNGTGVAGFGRAGGGYFSASGTVGTGVGVYGIGDKAGVNGQSTNGAGVVGTTASTGFNVAGVLGEATASSGTVVGVYGRALNDPGGTGVAGFGQTGGYFQATGTGGQAIALVGNAVQDRASGGMVKAMAFINPLLPTGQQIVRCYNSQATGGNVSTPPCGLSLIDSPGSFPYVTIDFGFQVDDRFISLTPWFNGPNNIGVMIRNIIGNRVSVFAFYADEVIDSTYGKFIIFVY